MNILTLTGITKSIGIRKLFDGCDMYLDSGEKIGIIGINGTGKSSLLKIIAGIDEPDDGKIIRMNNCVIAFLPQNPQFEKGETVIQAATKGLPENLEIEAKKLLVNLGEAEFDRSCDTLSGGEKKRVALVRTILTPADIIILDEPTNHLDSEMNNWLEETLRNTSAAVIMVTHDRYFLDSVCSRIVELDKGKLYSYSANYSGYLELKMEREEMQMATDKKRANILRNELKWVRRGAQARTTKQKARLQRFDEMSKVENFKADDTVQISSIVSRLGRTTVELNGISKAYGERALFAPFTYNFLKDDRVGFVGSNGSGKSTLLKMIVGDVTPDSGSIEIGQTVKIGYYAQEVGDEELNPRDKVIDYIRDVAEIVDTVDGKITASALLERFLFAGEDQHGLIGKLSGGERRRLYLCKVLMSAPNVLILDEPTNDLDIATLRILEDYLDSFPGIVIAVSHDRYFLDRVVRRIFAIEDGALRQYEGGYTDYYNKHKDEMAFKSDLTDNRNAVASGRSSKGTSVDTDGTKDPNAGRTHAKKLKFTFQEQRDYETIEADIADLEERIAQLERDSLTFARDFVKLNEIMAAKTKAEEELEEKMDRWMYLEDLAARIEAEKK